MSLEIVVTIALSAIGGLCILLWNTDGSLDWIATVAGISSVLTWFCMNVWNWELGDVAQAAANAAGDRSVEVLEAVYAQRFPPTVLWPAIGFGLVLCALPFIFNAARKARR